MPIKIAMKNTTNITAAQTISFFISEPLVWRDS